MVHSSSTKRVATYARRIHHMNPTEQTDTATATAKAPIKIRVQKGLFDLATFEDVTLVKEGSFIPPATTAEALAMLGNDNSKLMAVIIDGLKAEEMRKLRNAPEAWH